MSYSPDKQPGLDHIEDEYLVENRIGIHSVDSIKIHEAKRLPEEHILRVEPYFKEIDFSLYTDISFYYIGFEYEVCKESQFFYNGVMYDILAVGTLDGTEYIIGDEHVYEMSEYIALGYDFGTVSEQKYQNVYNKRKAGIIVNFENVKLGENIAYPSASLNNPYDLDRNSSDSENNSFDLENNPFDLDNNESVLNVVDWYTPPDTIKVYITATKTVKEIQIDAYAKCVLPNEWYSSWNAEALKAGVLVIKTYAWYNVVATRKPASQYGAHVTDDPNYYQHFVENSNQPATDNAVYYMEDFFVLNSDYTCFDAQYRAGIQGQYGIRNSGVLTQWGLN